MYLDGNDNGQLDWTDGDGDTQWEPDEGERWTLTLADDPPTRKSTKRATTCSTGLAPGVHIVRAVGEADWLQTTPMENDLTSARYGDPQLGNSQYVATGDFDGDDDIDVVVAYGDAWPCCGTMATAIWRPGGHLRRPQPVHCPTRSLWRMLDDDDDLDLAVANYFTSDVTILLNDGSGAFSRPVAVRSPSAICPDRWRPAIWTVTVTRTWPWPMNTTATSRSFATTAWRSSPRTRPFAGGRQSQVGGYRTLL